MGGCVCPRAGVDEGRPVVLVDDLCAAWHGMAWHGSIDVGQASHPPERESFGGVVAVQEVDLSILLAILNHMHSQLVILRPWTAAHGHFDRRHREGGVRRRCVYGSVASVTTTPVQPVHGALNTKFESDSDELQRALVWLLSRRRARPASCVPDPVSAEG